MREQLPEASTERWNNLSIAWAEAVLFRNIRDLTDDEKLQNSPRHGDHQPGTASSPGQTAPDRQTGTYGKTSVCSGITFKPPEIWKKPSGQLTTPHNTGDEDELQKTIISA